MSPVQAVRRFAPELPADRRSPRSAAIRYFESAERAEKAAPATRHTRPTNRGPQRSRARAAGAIRSELNARFE